MRKSSTCSMKQRPKKRGSNVFTRARNIFGRLMLAVKVVILVFEGMKTTAIEMLFIERIIAGRLTINDVPNLIRGNVNKTLRDMGYPDLADPLPEEEVAGE